MQKVTEIFERRTSADVVFEQLQEEIVSLQILPGTKLSEVEVARRFGVSRQPVRDAFARLSNLDLILIQPQKATRVRGFSLEHIAHARFVRLSIELEVVRRACAIWDETRVKELSKNIDQQRQAIDSDSPNRFHMLDAEFHKKICELSGFPLASETIEEAKGKIERLCVLSLGRESEAETLWNDHLNLAHALERQDTKDAANIVRLHLSRLDDTVSDIHQKHADYFE